MENLGAYAEDRVDVTHNVGGGCCWCELNCELNSNLVLYQINTYYVY